MLTENIQIVKEALKQYLGNGKYQILFVICLLYICIKEKDKNKRAILFYFPILVLFFILNPVFNKCIDNLIDKVVYWRTYWMLPVGLIIAYTGTSIIKSVPEKIKKSILYVLIIFIIMLSGRFIYTNENYVRYNNWNKIPDNYLDVINVISELELPNKKAMISTDLVPYIRQIDASIKIPYERRPEGDYNIYSIVNFYYAGDTKNLKNICERNNVNIIVYDKNIELHEPLSNYGFELCAQVNKYDIYIIKK